MKRIVRACLVLSALFAFVSTLHADTSLAAYGTFWEGDDSGQGGGMRLKKTFMGFGAVEGRGGYVEFNDLGVEATFLWFGAMTEVRYHDIEGSHLDGTAINLGLLVKW